MTDSATFGFDNSYARELQGFHVPWRPAVVPAPKWLFLNRVLVLLCHKCNTLLACPQQGQASSLAMSS